MLYRPSPYPYRPHNPNWRQPLYLHLRPLWRDLSETLPNVTGRVLDVGCGLQPYRAMMTGGVTEYVGLDREGPLTNPTLIGDVEHIPSKDNYFDAVLATQVLEHVREPHKAVHEMARVLKPGGTMIMTVPFVWPHHEEPHDYFRYTRYGLESLLAQENLIVEKLLPQGGFFAVVGQMLNLKLQRHWGWRNIIPLINLIAYRLDRNPTQQKLCLNWFIQAQKSEQHKPLEVNSTPPPK